MHLIVWLSHFEADYMLILPDVAILLVGSQVTGIISFFVARNIRVARQRVWDQTVASRGKGPDFWQPYVEEWDSPPVVNERPGRLDRMFKLWFWKLIIQKGDSSMVYTELFSEASHFQSSYFRFHCIHLLAHSLLQLSKV